MGFFAKLFGLQTRCPACGAQWAKESFFSGVKCVSPDCRHYDRTYAAKVFKNPITAGCPACGTDWAKMASFSDIKCVSPSCRHYDAAYASGGGKNPITIEYVNFRGEQKRFTGDADSMRIRGAHLTLQVGPTGRRIALKRDRISHRESVEQEVGEVASEMPSSREKHVLRYHQKRGATSRLYKSLRAKYPDF